MKVEAFLLALIEEDEESPYLRRKLPLPAEFPVPPSYSAQRGRLVQTIRDAMQSLLSGWGAPLESFSPDPVQQDVWNRAFELARLAGERADNGPLQGEEATLKALPQGRGDYMP